MSQVSWQEKEAAWTKRPSSSKNRRFHSFDHENGGQDNGANGSSHDNGSSSDTTSFRSSQHLTTPIPPNIGSKQYSMEEVFAVWFENEAKILTMKPPLLSVEKEKYKYPELQQIYHLDVHSHASKSPESSGLVDSFRNLLNSAADQTVENQAKHDVLIDSIALKNQIEPMTNEWCYIDPSGNEQGPFSGEMMQQWFADGYLTPQLQIRRKEDQSYQTLQDICEAAQNFISPFVIPLSNSGNQNSTSVPQTNQNLSSFTDPSVSHPQFSQLFSNGQGPLTATSVRMNPSVGAQSNLFGGEFINNDPFAPLLTNQKSTFGIEPINTNIGLNNVHSIPSFLQQQIQQTAPSLSRTNSNWALDSSNGLLGSAPGTPVAIAPAVASMIPQNPPISPWSSHSRGPSPFVPSSNLQASSMIDNDKPAKVDLDIGELPSVVSDILNDGEEENFTDTVAPTLLAPEAKNESQITPPAQNETQDTTQPYDRVLNDEKNVEIEKAKGKQSKKPLIADSAPVRLSPLLAPWANSMACDNQVDEKGPKLSLKEIQRMEAEKLEKLKKLQTEKKTELHQSWTEDDTENIVFPKTASWASNNNGSLTGSKKTLADIQKEESEAAAKAKASKPNSASFATAVANSTPKVDSAWTTVTSKKVTSTKKPVQTITNTSSWASKANPQVLRSVSASEPVNSSNNAVAVKEEFLIWARNAMMNLYPTVSKDDLLEIFVTLPSSGPESSQLIAETIYSSSATMDGRRFAQEFIKRRQRVEQQSGGSDDTSWRSAITSSAGKFQTVDEDGWSTSVKPKKKNRN
ncbi:uncharacterized protein PRCAT00002259001 [Priceomyces carsonii]|uniref:uncharacterized protein n=1 Tax=Priceomyces carsonii TaxID=28549 RepID=UPI002ED8A3D1|nr:unnamed protein product [Priceomyces carsonii]